MSETTSVKPNIPSWIAEGLECNFNDDEKLVRRGNTRHAWVRLASLQASLRIVNVSADGVGLISREAFSRDQRIELTPDGVSEDGTPYETAVLRVVHCTPAINGFKIGCVFI